MDTFFIEDELMKVSDFCYLLFWLLCCRNVRDFDTAQKCTHIANTFCRGNTFCQVFFCVCIHPRNNTIMDLSFKYGSILIRNTLAFACFTVLESFDGQTTYCLTLTPQFSNCFLTAIQNRKI